MTRKHFKELAKILNENKASKELVKDVILFCKTQNRNFDSFRFIDACEEHYQEAKKELEELINN